MRPSTLIASVCLVLISLWHEADGRLLWAILFAAAALVNMVISVWLNRGGGALVSVAVPAGGIDVAKERAIRKGWLRITIFGWVASITGAFVFPPMSLVLAGLSMYATVRYRRSGLLIAAAEERGGAVNGG